MPQLAASSLAGQYQRILLTELLQLADDVLRRRCLFFSQKLPLPSLPFLYIYFHASLTDSSYTHAARVPHLYLYLRVYLRSENLWHPNAHFQAHTAVILILSAYLQQI